MNMPKLQQIHLDDNSRISEEDIKKLCRNDLFNDISLNGNLLAGVKIDQQHINQDIV